MSWLLLKTNADPAKLPMDGDEVDESTNVGEIPDVEPGATKKVTLKLAAGKYAMVCAAARPLRGRDVWIFDGQVAQKTGSYPNLHLSRRQAPPSARHLTTSAAIAAGVEVHYLSPS